MFRRVACLLFVINAGVATSAFAQTTADIVGLKLGMTPAEAQAALKSHDAGLAIATGQSHFTYTDGTKQFNTDPFLSTMEARRRGSRQATPEFVLHFTPPPNGGTLWAIDRREVISENQPTLAQYTEALKQKYGAPTAVSRNGGSLAWDLPAGRTACLRDPRDPGFPVFRPRSNADLAFLLRHAQQTKRAPADLSQCAIQLNYVLSTTGGQTISQFEALLVDIPAYAAASRAASEFVRGLENKVNAARESKGKAPAL